MSVNSKHVDLRTLVMSARHTRVLWDHVVYCSQYIQRVLMRSRCCTVRSTYKSSHEITCLLFEQTYKSSMRSLVVLFADIQEFSWDHVVCLFYESRCLVPKFNEFSWDHLFTVRRHSRVLWDHVVYCSNSTYKSSHEITLLYCSQYIQRVLWDHVVYCSNRHSRVLWDHVVYCSQYIQRVLMRSRCCTVHSTFKSSMRSRCLLFADIQEFYEITLFTVRTVHTRVSMRSRCLLFTDIQEFYEITLFTVHRHSRVLMRSRCLLFADSKSSMWSRCLLELLEICLRQYIQRVLMRSRCCTVRSTYKSSHEITLFTVHRHSRVLWDHVVYCSQTFKSSMRSRCLLFNSTYNEFSWDHVVVLFTVHSTSSHEITLLYCSVNNISRVLEIMSANSKHVDLIELLNVCETYNVISWDHVVYCSQTFKSSMRSRCLLFADIQEFYEITLFTVHRHSRVLWDHVVYCSNRHSRVLWDHVVYCSRQ